MGQRGTFEDHKEIEFVRAVYWVQRGEIFLGEPEGNIAGLQISRTGGWCFPREEKQSGKKSRG